MPRTIDVRQSMNELFRHRGGAIVVAVVLAIAAWTIFAGLAYWLWSLF
jgi:NhaP-type Na+/H+ or K+/H+ antiporter